MAIVVYDIETFLNEVRTFLREKMTTAVTAINTEKGDTLLQAVGNDAYFIQTLNNEATNYNPFVLIGVEDVTTSGDGPFLKRSYTVAVIVVIADNGNSDDIPKTLFRYQRVLEDLFNKNWASMKSSVKLKVRSLVPISFRMLDSSDNFRAIGVQLDFSIAF